MENISIKLYQKLLRIDSLSQQLYIQIIPDSLTWAALRKLIMIWNYKEDKKCHLHFKVVKENIC